MNIETLVGFGFLLAFAIGWLLWAILTKLIEIKAELQNVVFHTRRIPRDPND
jgi:uncharacterized membrane protein YciS (DUF1049 family)